MSPNPGVFSDPTTTPLRATLPPKPHVDSFSFLSSRKEKLAGGDVPSDAGTPRGGRGPKPGNQALAQTWAAQ